MSPLLELVGVLGIVTCIATPIGLFVMWISCRSTERQYDRQSSRSRRGPR